MNDSHIIIIVQIVLFVVIVVSLFYISYKTYAIKEDVDDLAIDTDKQFKNTKQTLSKTQKSLENKIHETKQDIDTSHTKKYHELRDNLSKELNGFGKEVGDALNGIGNYVLHNTRRQDRDLTRIHAHIDRQNLDLGTSFDAINSAFDGVESAIKSTRNAAIQDNQTTQRQLDSFYVQTANAFGDAYNAYATLNNDFIKFSTLQHKDDLENLRTELIDQQNQKVQDATAGLALDIKKVIGQTSNDLRAEMTQGSVKLQAQIDDLKKKLGSTTTGSVTTTPFAYV